MPLPAESDFYMQALEDIEFFGVSPQMYCLLKQRGQLDQTPHFFQARLEQKYTEVLFLNIFIKNQTEQLLNRFDEAGIAAIPLKGIYFAEKYFGHVGARGTSDIDVLIKPEQLQSAIDCVKSLGFTTEEEHIPAHFHWSFSKPLPNSPIPLTVELHWDLLKENTSSLNIEEFWRHAIPFKDYTHIKELSEHHTFYMICLHGWRHNLNSLKYILDIVQMIYVLRHELDYAVLFHDAASHKTLRRIKWALTVVYHYLPQLQAMKELPLKSSRLWWNYNAIRELEYKKIHQYMNIAYSQYLIFDSVTHGFHAIRNGLLPSKIVR